MSEPAPARELIVIVGPCASGKSTLGERLRRAGYNVRTAAQEHSYVPTMWQMSNPDYLIYLHVEIATIRRRRQNPRWSEVEWQAQQERLAHARQHADLIIPTDDLSADAVEAEAKAMLAAKLVQQQTRPKPTVAVSSPPKPTRLRFETRAAIVGDVDALAELLGQSPSDTLIRNRAVAVATDTPRANLYAEYGGEIIGTVSWQDTDPDDVVLVQTPRFNADGYSPRAILARLIRTLPGLVDEAAITLRYAVSLKELTGAGSAEVRAAFDEFQAVGYQFAAHMLVMRDGVTTVQLDEDDSQLRQEYEARGYQLADEFDYYEMAVHPSGYSLDDYLRQAT